MSDAALATHRFEGGWLRDRPFDTVFIFGVLGVALASGALVIYQPQLFVLVLFIDFWLFGYHHVIATFTKLAGTVEDRREYKFLIYYLPFIVLGAVVAMATLVGIWLVVTVYFFWQWYHYTRQAYGVNAFYRRRAARPVAEDPRFALAALWSVPIWGILSRAHQGWDEFLGQPIWMPEVPLIAVTVAGVVSCSLVLLWVVTRVQAWRRGSLPLGQTFFMASHFVAFYVGYILIDDINAGWLVANMWHNAQYILFVWLYNTNRFRKPGAPDAGWLSWATQPGDGRAAAYFAICLAITAVAYGSMMSGYHILFSDNAALFAMLYVISFQTINFHHYVVDSYIWKARQKKHQDVMSLSRG